jgi:hypothetical protein
MKIRRHVLNKRCLLIKMRRHVLNKRCLPVKIRRHVLNKRCLPIKMRRHVLNKRCLPVKIRRHVLNKRRLPVKMRRRIKNPGRRFSNILSNILLFIPFHTTKGAKTGKITFEAFNNKMRYLTFIVLITLAGCSHEKASTKELGERVIKIRQELLTRKELPAPLEGQVKKRAENPVIIPSGTKR